MVILQGLQQQLQQQQPELSLDHQALLPPFLTLVKSHLFCKQIIPDLLHSWDFHLNVVSSWIQE